MSRSAFGIDIEDEDDGDGHSFGAYTVQTALEDGARVANASVLGMVGSRQAMECPICGEE